MTAIYALSMPAACYGNSALHAKFWRFKRPALVVAVIRAELALAERRTRFICYPELMPRQRFSALGADPCGMRDFGSAVRLV